MTTIECDPVKGIENVCVGSTELVFKKAIAVCNRLGYKLATFRDGEVLEKVATILSKQSHLKSILKPAEKLGIIPIRPIIPIIPTFGITEKYLVGLTFNENEARWYDEKICKDDGVLELFVDGDEDFFSENEDCFDAVMKVKYLNHSFSLEEDCGKQPYKFLCSKTDVTEKTETIATSTLVSTASRTTDKLSKTTPWSDLISTSTNDVDLNTTTQLNSTTNNSNSNNTLMSFFGNLNPSIFYSVVAAIGALFIILLVVCLVLLRKSPKRKQPNQVGTTVCKVEENVYDMPPAKHMEMNEIYDRSSEFPEYETKGESTSGPIPSAPEFYDITNEIYDGVPDEVYDTIDDVTFKK